MKIRQNHVDYGYKPQFDAALFSEPSVNYWMAYSWIWNGDIDEDGIRQRIDDMFRENIRAMYILPEPDEFRPTTMGTHMNPGYFSPRYFELYRYAAEYALSKGMQVWLYDEAGWPSGMANGEVVQKNPELIRKTIAVNVKNYLAGTPYVKPDDVLAAFTEDNTYIDGAYTPASDERISEYVIQNVRYTNMPGPDLMDPRTAKEFLRCTHERYKAHMGDLFGPNFKITFTDEPAISRTPWTDGLDIKFKERFGYDFRRYLPAILQNAPMGEKGQQAKIDYFELCSEIFAESYFQSLQNWAKDNGMLSAGHIGGEDDTLGCVTAGYMNALRQLRCFDIPGIDTIWRQIFPKERDYRNGKVEAHNLFFPRFCTSAARQASSRPTVSESYAIYGSGLTCDQMRYVMNFQAVRGINIFNAMNLTYCLEDHFMAGARPTFSPMMPGSSDKAVFHEYAARLSYINSVGTPEVTTAVYMPIHDFWLREDSEYIRDEFEKIGKTIEAHQGVFDVFDDDVILNAASDALKQGRIKVGLADYTELWIPPCRRMPNEVKTILEEFIAGGGKLFVLKGKYDPQIKGQRIVEDIAGAVKPFIGCEPANERIRVMKRITDKGNLYFVYNEGFTSTSNLLRFAESKKAYELDLSTGRVYPANAESAEIGTDIPVTLECGEGRVYYFTDDVLKVVEHPQAHGEVFATISEFGFRRIRSFVIGEHKFENIPINESERKIGVGKWNDLTGDDFSGDAVYTAEFARPDAEEFDIDLGTVNYSCELFINGRSMGVRCMRPYRYTVRTDELKPINKLEIRVSNTAANQYVFTKELDKYTPGQIGPYHATTKTFEKESVDSGLYGPVRFLK